MLLGQTFPEGHTKVGAENDKYTKLFLQLQTKARKGIRFLSESDNFVRDRVNPFIGYATLS